MSPKPLLLSEDQEREIKAALKGTGPFEVLIVCEKGDKESFDLSLDLSRILRNVGWIVEEKSWSEVVAKPADTPKRLFLGLTSFFVGVSDPTSVPDSARCLLVANRYFFLCTDPYLGHAFNLVGI